MDWMPCGGVEAQEEDPQLVGELSSVVSHSYSVPVSVDGAAAMMPILQKYTSRFSARLDMFILYVELYGMFTLQVFLVNLVWSSAKNQEGKGELLKEGDPHDWQLMAICLLLFHQTIWKELIEAWDFTLFVKKGMPTQAGMLRYKRNLETKRLELVSGGMTYFYKVRVFVFIIVPKSLIAVYLVIAGSFFLIRSPDRQELLQNTLATTFISNVDEIFFRAINPRYQRFCLRALPPYNISRADHKDQMRGCAFAWWALRRVCFSAFTVLICMFILKLDVWDNLNRQYESGSVPAPEDFTESFYTFLNRFVSQRVQRR